MTYSQDKTNVRDQGKDIGMQGQIKGRDRGKDIGMQGQIKDRDQGKDIGKDIGMQGGANKR